MQIQKKFLLLILVSLLIPASAFASGTGMPWENPMNQILNSITGPWLRFGSVVAIIITGLTLAVGERGGLLKHSLQVVLGLSIACAATSWGLSFFGFSGGLAF
jgi:Type IV secretory pathway, VirB2 components (pilins)